MKICNENLFNNFRMEKENNKITVPSNMDDQSVNETEKSKIHIIVEIIEYMPNAVVSKTIIKKHQAMLPSAHLLLKRNSLKKNLHMTRLSRS